MSKGYVYILTNDAMPGLVKIGRTSRDVEIRASELWQTGVPERFSVYAQQATCDCVQLEAYVHGDLKKHRVSKSREFFAVDPEVARERVRFWVQVQAWDLASENFDNFTAVPYDLAVSSLDVERLAKETGQPVRLIADAMEMLTADEIKDAIERARAKREAEHREDLLRLGIPEERHWKAYE